MIDNTARDMMPCPFCGYGCAVVSDNERGLKFNVHCGRCRASGPWERCAIDAKDAWNARVTEVKHIGEER